jgi:hypothetical protein
MRLRVPRSIPVMDRASLQRLRNYAKGVMERTIWADERRYEQLTELLCFRIDARIAAQNTSVVSVAPPKPLGLGIATGEGETIEP